MAKFLVLGHGVSVGTTKEAVAEESSAAPINGHHRTGADVHMRYVYVRARERMRSGERGGACRLPEVSHRVREHHEEDKEGLTAV